MPGTIPFGAGTFGQQFSQGGSDPSIGGGFFTSPFFTARFFGAQYWDKPSALFLPTVTSATINANGTLAIHFSTAVFPGTGAITFTLNGTASVITGLSIAANSGLANLVPLPIRGQTITMNYVAGNVHDGSANFMANFSNFPVTNNYLLKPVITATADFAPILAGVFDASTILDGTFDSNTL